MPGTHATTHPISAESLPLPTGAATEATLSGVKTGTDRLDILLSALRDALAGAGAAARTQGDLNTALTNLLTELQAKADLSETQPVSGPLTDVQLRASTVPISGTVTASGPLTDAQLRASAVPISGTVTANSAASTNRIGGVYPVGGQIIDENGTVRTVNRSFANATATGNTQVVAAQGVGVRVRVLSYSIVALLAVTVKFQSATTDISSGKPIGANGGIVAEDNPHGYFQTAADEPLNINLSLGTTVGVDITWIQAT